VKYLFILACAFNAHAALTGVSCNSNVDYFYHSAYYKYHVNISFTDKNHGLFSYSFMQKEDGVLYEQGKVFFHYVTLPNSEWLNLTTDIQQKYCSSTSKKTINSSLLTCKTENIILKTTQLENAIRFVSKNGTMFICVQPP